MGVLLERWLLHYDPIHRGYTQRGIANGVTATCGWGFPRVGGGYNLYRSVNGAAVDGDRPVGAAGRSATSIESFSWRPHAVSTDYAYSVRSIGGGGVESADSEGVLAAFDGVGALIGPAPHAASDVAVRAISGGRFEVRWRYDAAGEAVAPAMFRLFHDGGSGTVDYGTVVGTVTYGACRALYAYVSGGFGHDVRRVWGVRAVSDEGVEEENELTAAAWSDDLAPSVGSVLHVGLGYEY